MWDGTYDIGQFSDGVIRSHNGATPPRKDRRDGLLPKGGSSLSLESEHATPLSRAGGYGSMSWSSSSGQLQTAAPLQANGHAHPPPATVKELLHQAGQRHEGELGALRQELRLLCRENERLRSLLPGGRADAGDALTPQGVLVSLSEKGNPAAPPTPGGDAAWRAFGTTRFDDKAEPVGDAKKFRIKASWERDVRVPGSRPLDNFMGEGARVHELSSAGQRRQMNVSENFPNDKGCVISPDSSGRLLWDMMGLNLICYDLLTIPLVQCFSDSAAIMHATERGLFSWMDWVTLIFWTGDMAQGFFLGFWENGVPVTDKRRIFANYMRTWFVVDVLVVAPEWLLIFAKSMMQDAGAGGIGLLGKILKSARAIRVLRLVRLVKLQRIVNKCYDMISDEQTFIAVNLFKLLVAILALNHVIACCWYGLGRLGRGDADWYMREPENWIDNQQLGDGTMGYRYTTSLHWSLTQFTPASMQVSATNVGERIFSIVVLFFAMVCFSSIVGSITGSMTQLRSLKNDDAKQFWLLRRYLKQKMVDKSLQQRILKHLEYQVSMKGNQVQESNLKVLSQLSEELSRELEHDLSHDHWAEHPFFRLMDKQTTVILHLIDHNRAGKKCLNQRYCSESERIFDAGDEAKFMLFVCWPNRSSMFAKRSETKAKECEGQPPSEAYFEYTVPSFRCERHSQNRFSQAQSIVTQKEGQSERMALCSGEWVSEAVLWTADWRHMGELMCCYVCPILTVEPETFFKVVHSHPRSWFLAKTYARMFVNWINDEDPKHRMDTSKVTDVIRSGRAWLDSEALWYKETGEFLEAQLEEMVEKARKASEEAAVQHLEHCVSDDGSQDVPNGCGGSRPGKHVDAGDHQLARPGSEEAPKGRRGAEGARRVEPSPARGAEGPGRCRPACEALASASPAQRGPRRVLAGLCGGH